MKIERRLSLPTIPVVDQVHWRIAEVRIANADGSERFRAEVEVPLQWSDTAAGILASKYLRKAGVPDDVVFVPEKGIPDWLCRCRSNDFKGGPKVNYGSETSAKQVFHRMVGCWTYWAWREGLFFDPADRTGWTPNLSSEEYAKIFYDELYLMLALQIAAPNSPQWFNTGLHWSYGIEGPASGQWTIDYDLPNKIKLTAQRMAGDVDLPEDLTKLTGFMYETQNSYERPQPHACFIQTVKDDLVNPGGIMDLWMREVRLFKYGSGTGSNFSSVRGINEPLSAGGLSSGLMSFLRIGDRAAGSIKSGGTTRRAAKMVCLDADHPEVEAFIDWKVHEEEKAAAISIGSQVMRNHYIFGSNKEDETYLAIPHAMLDRMAQGFEPGLYPVGWESEAIETVSGQNSNNSVRFTDDFMERVENNLQWDLTARTTGKPVKTLPARYLWQRCCRATWAAGDPGVQFHDTINQWHTCLEDGEIVASNPCAEYVFINDTACNLASLNLLRFVSENGDFDIEAFDHAVRLWTMVLDISVHMASFPSREIAIGSYNYRTLGLGYANLGAALMAQAIPYDSDAGRAFAANVTALLTGVAYRTSAEMASEVGPFPRYEANRDHMRRVLLNHALALTNEPFKGVTADPPRWAPMGFDELRDYADRVWAEALSLGAQHGYRNAQVSLIAPTGTISFVLDCDTTGVEPDLALIKIKNLAGGGQLTITNQTVERALRKLNYPVEYARRIVELLAENGGDIGALPTDAYIRHEDLPVFDTANPPRPGGRYLAPMAHVLMVAAVQPFLSGAVSKTVNLPHDATPEDVDNVYRRAHKLGVKAIAPYRDGSKLSQPLSSAGNKKLVDTSDIPGAGEEWFKKARLVTPNKKEMYPELVRGGREPLPGRREGYTQKVRVEDQSIYLRTGEYPDGRLGEVFVTWSREGSTVRSLMECFAKAVSIGLQYGVPLPEFVDAFVHTKFEPAGIVTGHDEVKICSSVVDLIFRDAAVSYLGRQELAHNGGGNNAAVGMAPPGNGGIAANTHEGPTPIVNGDTCPECGAMLEITGTCKSCRGCGYNTGCG